VYYLASVSDDYVLNLVLYSAGDYTTDIELLQYDMWAGTTQIGFILAAILVGDIAGDLNNKSTSFERMLGSSFTASATIGFWREFPCDISLP
jgi:hypothetical protein